MLTNNAKSYRNILIKSNLILILTFISCTLPLISSPVHESPYGKDASMASLGSKVRTGVLSNGVHYIICGTNSRGTGFEARLVVGAGSMAEREDQLGIAHLIEHMEFQGTGNFSRQDIFSFVEANGVKFGQGMNGFTNYSCTQYYISLPYAKTDLISMSLRILDDWAHGPKINPSVLENEKKVVIEEIRMRKMNINGQLQSFINDALHEGTNASNRNPLGTIDHVSGFTAEDINEFVSDWYRPDNMCILLTGRFDAEVMEQSIKNIEFTKFTKKHCEDLPLYKMPVQTEDKSYRFFDPELTSDRVLWLQYADTAAKSRLEAYKWDLAALITGEALNMRLRSLIFEGDTKYTSAGFYTHPLPEETRGLVWFLSPNYGKSEQAVYQYITEVRRIQAHGITTEEFKRGIKIWNDVTGASITQLANVSVTERNTALANAWLFGYWYPYTDEHFSVRKSTAEEISMDDVQTWIQQYFSPSPSKLILQLRGRLSNLLGIEKTLTALRDGALLQEIDPIKIVKTPPLLPSQPVPGSIISEEKIAGTPYEKWTLSNGVSVFLYKTRNPKNDFLLKAFSPGGLSILGDEDMPYAYNCTDAFSYNGAGNLSYVQLSDYLTGKKTQITFSVEPAKSVIFGTTDPADPDDMTRFFKLLHAQILYPRRDTGSEKYWRNIKDGSYRSRVILPEERLNKTLNKLMTGNSYRRRALTSEDLKSTDYDRLFEIRNRFFGNITDFTFIITGDYDKNEVRQLVSQWIASIPADAATKSMPIDHGIRTVSGPVEEIVYAGNEDKAKIVMVMEKEQALSIDDYAHSIILKNLLDILLRESIRNEQGGTYYVKSECSMELYPYCHSIVKISFTCKPERLEELKNRVVVELNKIKSGDIESETFENVMKISRKYTQPNFQTNALHMERIYQVLSTGFQPESIFDYDSALNSTEIDDLVRTADKLLNTEEIITAILMPENMAQNE